MISRLFAFALAALAALSVAGVLAPADARPIGTIGLETRNGSTGPSRIAPPPQQRRDAAELEESCNIDNDDGRHHRAVPRIAGAAPIIRSVGESVERRRIVLARTHRACAAPPTGPPSA
jgi:hypothetical protein